MIKNILVIAFLIVCLTIKAQNLYVFNSSYIIQLGNSEAYQTATEEDNRSKFDTWPILDANKAVKSV